MTSSLWAQQQAQMGRDVANDPAYRAKTAAAAQYQRVRANPHLSAEGKRAHIAKAYLDVKRQLAEISQQEQTQRQQRINDLHRRTFGAPRDPAAAMSWRQARMLAADIGDDHRKANWEMDRALRSGDTDFAKALAEHATEHLWGDVYSKYTDANPQFAESMNELAQLQNPDPQTTMMRNFDLLEVKPSELGNAHDGQIESFAEQAQ